MEPRLNRRLIESGEGKLRIASDIAAIESSLKRRSIVTLPTPEQAETLLPFLASKAHETKEALLPLKGNGMNYQDAFYEASRRVRAISRQHARRSLYNAIEFRTEDLVRDDATRSTVIAMCGDYNPNDEDYIPEKTKKYIDGILYQTTMYLRWQSISDLPDLLGESNPWGPIVDMQSLGALHVRFEANTLRADVPMIVDGYERALGCWNDKQGKIPVTHAWGAECPPIT